MPITIMKHGSNHRPPCPECGSENIYTIAVSMVSPVTTWCCRDCGCEYSEGDPEPQSGELVAEPIRPYPVPYYPYPWWGIYPPWPDQITYEHWPSNPYTFTVTYSTRTTTDKE